MILPGILLLPHPLYLSPHTLLILHLNCLSTLKRLQDCKQKSAKLVTLETPPYLPSMKYPNVGLSQVWWDSEGHSRKLLPVIPLNSQGKTKIKVNGKPCQLPVDTWAIFSKLNSLMPELTPGKNCQKSAKGETPYQHQFSQTSVVPGHERKVKLHIVPFFPNPDPLLIGPCSPTDSYCTFLLVAFCVLRI